MSVPTYDHFIEPILRYLVVHPAGAPAKEVHEAVADVIALTNDDRLERLPSGVQLVYKNRAGWGHDRLKRAGFSSSPRRGFWKLTEKGIEFAKTHPAPLSTQEIENLAIGYMDVRLRPLGVDIESTPHTPLEARAKQACLSQVRTIDLARR